MTEMGFYDVECREDALISWFRFRISLGVPLVSHMVITELSRWHRFGIMIVELGTLDSLPIRRPTCFATDFLSNVAIDLSGIPH